MLEAGTGLGPVCVRETTEGTGMSAEEEELAEFEREKTPVDGA